MYLSSLWRAATLAAACLLIPRHTQAQPAPPRDPYGLMALDSAYRLVLGDLTLDVQQGGMKHFKPYVLPLIFAPGVEVWGKDEIMRPDHLTFHIRYGQYRNDGPPAPIRDTDVPKEIGVEHKSTNADEHRMHHTTLRGVRAVLGAPTGCVRDTTYNGSWDEITVATTALWKRPGVSIRFRSAATHRAPTTVPRERPPTLEVSYSVVRDGAERPGIRTVVPMTDAALCAMPETEVDAQLAPWDVARFERVRQQLRR